MTNYKRKPFIIERPSPLKKLVYKVLILGWIYYYTFETTLKFVPQKIRTVADVVKAKRSYLSKTILIDVTVG